MHRSFRSNEERYRGFWIATTHRTSSPFLERGKCTLHGEQDRASVVAEIVVVDAQEDLAEWSDRRMPHNQ